MQNIVEIIRRDTKMVIVLRNVTSDGYNAQCYVRQSNGEFQRIGTLIASYDRQHVMDSAQHWISGGSIVLANR